MNLTAELLGIEATLDAIGDAVARTSTATMSDARDGMKADLREQIVSAGMGVRLGNTWRGEVYPKGRPSVNAAAYVYSRAPLIVDAFNRGVTIRPVNGRRYLAIPTANVPPRRRGGGFGGRGAKASPFEVETIFNQDLRFAKAGNGRLVAYVEVIGAKNRKGYRAPTKGRMAQGRRPASVVMFIMVPVVTLPKHFDIEAVAQRWADRVPSLFDANWRQP